MTASRSDRWLSVEEIAAHLGVKPTSIYKWITRKGMPAHKVGRLWKFRLKEVDEWSYLARQRKGTMSSGTEAQESWDGMTAMPMQTQTNQDANPQVGMVANRTQPTWGHQLGTSVRRAGGTAAPH